MTSQAFVACSLQDRKAETGFPPTVTTFISSVSDMAGGAGRAACAAGPGVSSKTNVVGGGGGGGGDGGKKSGQEKNELDEGGVCWRGWTTTLLALSREDGVALD